MSNDQIQAEDQDPLELEIWRAHLDSATPWADKNHAKASYKSSRLKYLAAKKFERQRWMTSNDWTRTNIANF
jgi:hypothetical protein